MNGEYKGQPLHNAAFVGDVKDLRALVLSGAKIDEKENVSAHAPFL